jgi:magnesium chelatase family protein
MPDGEPSVDIRSRVEKARRVQLERFADAPIFTNAQMSTRTLKRYCPLGPPVRTLIEQAMNELHLSARAYHRIVKVARTIADLEGAEEIDVPHVAEAVQYRSLDRSYWA